MALKEPDLGTICCPEGAMPSVPEGRSDRSQARSAWDSAPSKEPSRRVRSDSRRYAHRFDDRSEPSLKNTAHLSTQNTSGRGSAPDHTVPYGTVLWGGAAPGTSCLA